MRLTNVVPLAGGCLCGEVRYEIDAAGVFDVGCCQGSTYRRATGAPVPAWVQRRAARLPRHTRRASHQRIVQSGRARLLRALRSSAP